MNAKKAKMLRRIAREKTVGAPAVNYIKNTDGSIVLYKCTRGAYQALKRAYKKGLLHKKKAIDTAV